MSTEQGCRTQHKKELSKYHNMADSRRQEISSLFSLQCKFVEWRVVAALVSTLYLIYVILQPMISAQWVILPGTDRILERCCSWKWQCTVHSLLLLPRLLHMIDRDEKSWKTETTTRQMTPLACKHASHRQISKLWVLPVPDNPHFVETRKSVIDVCTKERDQFL